MRNERTIYFDINVFRRITRNVSHWQRLEEFFDKEEPGLLDNATVLFTWSQLLEASDLGTIINKIEKTDIWKEQIEGKKLIDKLGFQKGLDKYFATTLKAIEMLPQLQKDALLKSVNKAISHTCPEAQKLVANTLIRYRDFITDANYMEPLSKELAWAFLTSYPFIKSEDQWEKRQVCYDSLIALWHKLRLEGHELVLFRLTERHYLSFLLYSSQVDMEQAKTLYPGIVTRQDLVDQIFKFPPLKQGSDLCDGEIIFFAYLANRKSSVVGVTMDEQAIIQQRMGIFDRSLTDLQLCVSEWNVEISLGVIFCLEMTNDGTINHVYRNPPRVSCGAL